MAQPLRHPPPLFGRVAASGGPCGPGGGAV